LYVMKQGFLPLTIKQPTGKTRNGSLMARYLIKILSLRTCGTQLPG